jgi:hypothetical protein
MQNTFFIKKNLKFKNNFKFFKKKIDDFDIKIKVGFFWFF